MIDRHVALHQANALHDVMGQRAEAAAAARALREREAGHPQEAENWEQIRSVLRERRAPHQG
ncbi:hypothetical protein [Jannaschia formosa]|uniref:hypothetical protein n=1 Tax=Jannaschia formosa TaxID=2259592 RepID=UPI000E1C3AAA|nr:hypothetical protein [Jannaschia formosa]TFL16964.1 hypothetical protein DR046_16975 [Jannaschia formosa]